MVKTNSSYKAEILKTATRLFVKKGYTDTTIANIAQSTGCSEGIIYHHFKNKEDILFSSIMTVLGKVKAGIELNNHDKTTTPVDELRSYTHNFLKQVLAARSGVPAYERWRAYLTPEHTKKVVELRKSSDNIIVTIIQRGVDEGFFRKDINVRLIGHYIISVIVNTRRWYSPKGELSIPDLAEEIFSFFLRSIRSSDSIKPSDNK